MLKNTALSHERSNYRPEVDGLRAFAIVPVVIHHFNKEWLPAGYLGVDIFFVISGLVITSSLLHKPSQGFNDNILSFYSRRVKRLMPALWVMILLGTILISLFNRAPGFSLQTGLTALFGVSNLYLFYQSTDYFAPASELNIFTHTWSLGVEEQFYLLFPILLWFTGAWRSGVGFTKKTKVTLGITLCILSLLSLGFFISLYHSRQAMAYFLMPSRFWEMGVGCLLALAPVNFQKSHQGLNGFFKRFLPWLSLAFIVVIFRGFSEQQGLEATILVVFLTCLLIATVQPNHISERREIGSAYQLLSHPFLVSVGIISYSLYLWHWPVFCLSRWTIGTPVTALPFLLAVIVVVSYISYNAIEQPLRQASWSSSRLQTLGLGLLMSALSGLFLLIIGGPLKGKLFTGRGGQDVEAARISSELLAKQPRVAERVKDMLRQCNATPFLLGQNSYKANRKIDQSLAEDCLRVLGFSSPKAIKNQPRVIMVGDSFAEKLAPFAAVAANRSGYNFNLFFGYGCTYLLRSDLIKNPSFPSCRYFNEQSLENALLKTINKGDVVLLRLHFGSKSYVRYPTGHEQPSPDSYDAAIEDLHRKIRAKEAHLIVVGGNPVLATQDLAALRPDWFNAWNRTSTIDPRNAQETKFFHSLDDHLSQRFGIGKDALYLSLKPVICGKNDTCILALKNKFLYEDDHHLSPYGHELFLPDLERRLRALSRS
jgi:peptidoglycan/LPS O-acetylase OafA/YrhL